MVDYQAMKGRLAYLDRLEEEMAALKVQRASSDMQRLHGLPLGRWRRLLKDLCVTGQGKLCQTEDELQDALAKIAELQELVNCGRPLQTL